MEEEQKFAKQLADLVRLAKSQGNQVSKEQVEEALSSLHLQEDKLQLVFAYLKEHKIGVDEEAGAQDELSKEDIRYLDLYLEEIQSLADMTEEEEQALILSAMTGDEDALNCLIELYLPRVVEFAKLYAGQGVLLEDLIGEGNVALAIEVRMLACADSTEDAKQMLAKAIMDAMEYLINENLDAGEADKRILDKINEIADRAKELAETVGSKVTVEELAKETDYTEAEIKEAIRITANKLDYIEEK